MAESYIRKHNAQLSSFAHPLISLVPADQRGVVNESAFLIFTEMAERGIPSSALSQEVLESCFEKSLQFIARMRQFSRIPPEPISDLGRIDAMFLADRLASYFSEQRPAYFRIRPLFPGCGWINSAEGDALSDRNLFEVKAGERLFRVIDLRQLLCYCALDFSAKLYQVETITLVNPRFGTFIQEDLDTLCQKIAGASAPDVLGEIVNYISEPFSRYSGV
jgi:hypothetical protein